MGKGNSEETMKKICRLHIVPSYYTLGTRHRILVKGKVVPVL